METAKEMKETMARWGLRAAMRMGAMTRKMNRILLESWSDKILAHATLRSLDVGAEGQAVVVVEVAATTVNSVY